MSRRTLLSSEQGARLFGISTRVAEMTKHYVLSPEDLALICAKRRSGNRLGFAVQLCLLRHPGQGLGFGEHPPEAIISFVVPQVGVPLAAFAGLRAPGPDTAEACRRAAEAAWPAQLPPGRPARLPAGGANAAWATDRGEPIIQAMLAHLRAERVLIPGAAMLKRIGLAARVRTRKRASQALAGA